MLNTGYGWIESKYNHMGLLFSDKKRHIQLAILQKSL